MLTRTHLSPLPLVAALLALAAVSGCADPRYCDVGKPCSDPAYPYCDLVRHECEATAPADGGVDASVDAPQRDGGDGPVASDGGDAGGDDAGDAGCTSPAHWCPGVGCVPNDVDHCGESCEQCTAPTNGHPTCDGTSCSFACDASYYLNSTTCDPCDVPAHCGPTCATCGGDRPDCSGHAGKCVCNGTSCSGTTPVCDSNTGACRGCQAHAECASGACDPSGGCVAADQIIYLDKNNASCTDSGGTAGEPGTPFCTFPPALTKALGGAGYLVVRPGTYSFTADTYVTNGTVVIIGSDPATTELVQTKNNRAVLKLVDASNVTLEGLTLRGAFGNDGHGVWCAGQSSAVGTLTVRRCVLQGNVLRGIDSTYCTVTTAQSTLSGNSGGGVFATNSAVTLTQSTVSGNQGGGVSLTSSDFVIENCLVAENGKSDPAGSNLGGVMLSSPGTPAIFINNTVVYNGVKAGATAGGVWCVGGGSVVNSILWGNGVAQQKDCSVDYSDVEGGVSGGTGNISGDPLFMDSGAGNYHLKTTPTLSPAINAGTSSGAPTVDLEGTARTNTPDMGCYEAQ